MLLCEINGSHGDDWRVVVTPSSLVEVYVSEERTAPVFRVGVFAACVHDFLFDQEYGCASTAPCVLITWFKPEKTFP
jgi:hypothetical protein